MCLAMEFRGLYLFTADMAFIERSAVHTQRNVLWAPHCFAGLGRRLLNTQVGPAVGLPLCLHLLLFAMRRANVNTS